MDNETTELSAAAVATDLVKVFAIGVAITATTVVAMELTVHAIYKLEDIRKARKAKKLAKQNDN